jgi:hypothetical protein
MAKAKSFGVNDYIKSRRKKRSGRHSKKHKKARFSKGQGKPS